MTIFITTKDLDSDNKLRPDYIERREKRNIPVRRRKAVSRPSPGMKRKG